MLTCQPELSKMLVNFLPSCVSTIKWFQRPPTVECSEMINCTTSSSSMEETNYIRWLRLHLLNTLIEFCTYLELKIFFTSSSKWFLLLTASLILISLHLIPIVHFEKRLSIFTFTILVQCKPFTTFWTEWSLIAGTVGFHTHPTNALTTTEWQLTIRNGQNVMNSCDLR